MASGEEGGVHHSFLHGPVNTVWESSGLADSLGVAEVPDHVVMGLLVLFLCAVTAIPMSRRLKLDNPGKFQQMLELVVEGLQNLMEDVTGHGSARRFMPMIGSLAVFIFLCNILGLFFFLQPPTQNTNTTFALSITAWLYYHFVGVRKHGLAYFKQFLGPVPALILSLHPARAHQPRGARLLTGASSLRQHLR